MNRRVFIKNTVKCGMLLTVGLVHETLWANIAGKPYDASSWASFSLEIPESLQQILDECSQSNISTYIFGGSIVALKKQRKLKEVSMLCHGGDFFRLKNALFRKRVRAIPNFGKFKNIIEFIYHEIHFTIEYTGTLELQPAKILDTAKNGIVSFKHNFLLYDCQSKEIMDPYEFWSGSGKVEGISGVGNMVSEVNNYLLAHREAETFDLEVGDQILNVENKFIHRECPKSEAMESSLLFLFESDCLLKIKGVQEFSKIFKSTYITSAFRNWAQCKIEPFVEQLPQICEKLQGKDYSDILVTSNLLLLVELEREQIRTSLPCLSLETEEVVFSVNYLPKMSRALAAQKDPDFFEFFL